MKSQFGFVYLCVIMFVCAMIFGYIQKRRQDKQEKWTPEAKGFKRGEIIFTPPPPPQPLGDGEYLARRAQLLECDKDDHRGQRPKLRDGAYPKIYQQVTEENRALEEPAKILEHDPSFITIPVLNKDYSVTEDEWWDPLGAFVPSFELMDIPHPPKTNGLAPRGFDSQGFPIWNYETRENLSRRQAAPMSFVMSYKPDSDKILVTPEMIVDEKQREFVNLVSPYLRLVSEPFVDITEMTNKLRLGRRIYWEHKEHGLDAKWCPLVTDTIGAMTYSSHDVPDGTFVCIKIADLLLPFFFFEGELNVNLNSALDSELEKAEQRRLEEQKRLEKAEVIKTLVATLKVVKSFKTPIKRILGPDFLLRPRFKVKIDDSDIVDPQQIDDTSVRNFMLETQYSLRLIREVGKTERFVWEYAESTNNGVKWRLNWVSLKEEHFPLLCSRYITKFDKSGGVHPDGFCLAATEFKLNVLAIPSGMFTSVRLNEDTAIFVYVGGVNPKPVTE